MTTPSNVALDAIIAARVQERETNNHLRADLLNEIRKLEQIAVALDDDIAKYQAMKGE